MNNVRSYALDTYSQDTHSETVYTARAAHNFTEFVDRIWSIIARSYKIRRTHNMLSDLDDRMLKDIGITRSEIPAAAYHSVEHPHIPYLKRA